MLADACNTHKRDFLPSLPHVDNWARRLVTHNTVLAELAADVRWESDLRRPLALARSCYAHLPTGTPLSTSPDEFAEHDPVLVISGLADLPPSG